MKQKHLLALLGLLAMGIVACGAFSWAATELAEDPHAGHFDHCAKACADCMRECESCARHCSDLVAAGKKDHVETLGTCADCAEFCAAAAKIVAHRGPLSGSICEACAKACDVCGGACEKFSGDQHMTACAKACRDCAKACREMLQHTGRSATK